MAIVKKNTSKYTETMERLRKRIYDWYAYYAENNKDYRDDINFLYHNDGQWTDDEKGEYYQMGKPRLTFNMLRRYTANIVGEFANNTPSLKVRALENAQADQQSVSLLEDLLRHISFDSRNDIVYATAFGSALDGGYGAFKINVERENVMSFNQTIRYEAIQDARWAFFDPSAREIDKSDGQYCGLSHFIKKDEFQERYPNASIPQGGNLGAAFIDAGFRWVTDDEVNVIDFYEKEFYKRHVALLSNGQVVDFEDAQKIVKDRNEMNDRLFQFGLIPNPIPKVTILSDEKREDYRINFYRMTSMEILESHRWEGCYLPIIFVGGNIKWVEGREKTLSFVRPIKDAQRAYNYARSDYVYRLKLNRYEPYIASEDNIAGHEMEWKQASTARSVLVFKHDAKGYVPQRSGNPPVDQGLILEMQQSLADMQNIPGRFEANIGAPGNETSGAAIAARQLPSNMSVKPFFVQIAMAIQSGAKVVLDLIQKVFDSQRTVTTRLTNGDVQQREINNPSDDKTQIPKSLFNVVYIK